MVHNLTTTHRFLVIMFYAGLLTLFGMTSCNSDSDEDITKDQLSELQTKPIQEEANSDQIRSVSEENNLLENGNLEQWIMLATYDTPSGWLSHNNPNVKKNTTIVYEGNFSARMKSTESGSTARLDQRIAVTPTNTIRIRFHYYIEQWKAKGARTYCYFRTDAAEKYNIPTDSLYAFYDKNDYHIIRGGGYGKTYLADSLGVWLTFDETIQVPPTANYFVFGINSYYGTSLYIDDCSISDITEQTITGITSIEYK